MGLCLMNLLTATAPMTCLRRRATGGIARRRILLQAVLLLVGKQGTCNILKAPAAPAAAQAHACCLHSNTMLMKLVGDSCRRLPQLPGVPFYLHMRQHCCWLSQRSGASVFVCSRLISTVYS